MSAVAVGNTDANKGIIRIAAVRDAGAFAAAVQALEEEHGIAVETLTIRGAATDWNSAGERFTFKRRKGGNRANHGLYLTSVEAW